MQPRISEPFKPATIFFTLFRSYPQAIPSGAEAKQSNRFADKRKQNNIRNIVCMWL